MLRDVQLIHHFDHGKAKTYYADRTTCQLHPLLHLSAVYACATQPNSSASKP